MNQHFPMSPPRYAAMWDAIAATGSRGQTFHPHQIISYLVQRGWKRKTAELYWSRFTIWATTHDDEFAGPKSRLTKSCDGYRLADKDL